MDAITRAESSLAALRASYETGRGELGECSRRSARSARRAWRAPGPAPIWPSPRPTSPARPENRSPKEKRQDARSTSSTERPRLRPFASVSSRRPPRSARGWDHEQWLRQARCRREREARRSRAGGAAIYHCPMHPTYTSDRPGDCLICNMRLVRTDRMTRTFRVTTPCPPRPIRRIRGRGLCADRNRPRGAHSASAFAWRGPSRDCKPERSARSGGSRPTSPGSTTSTPGRRLGPPRVRGHDRADRARRPTAPLLI